MDMPVNKFKQGLREGRTQLGAWLVSGAPSTAEALGCAGFDFLVINPDAFSIPDGANYMVQDLCLFLEKLGVKTKV